MLIGQRVNSGNTGQNILVGDTQYRLGNVTDEKRQISLKLGKCCKRGIILFFLQIFLVHCGIETCITINYFAAIEYRALYDAPDSML